VAWKDQPYWLVTSTNKSLYTRSVYVDVNETLVLYICKQINVLLHNLALGCIRGVVFSISCSVMIEHPGQLFI